MERGQAGSDEVFGYNIIVDKWLRRRALPNLNDQRYRHSSCTVGKTVAVIAGQTRGGMPISTIELLEVRLSFNGTIFSKSDAWQLCDPGMLTGRVLPVVAAIGR